jgi:hypothetical protein
VCENITYVAIGLLVLSLFLKTYKQVNRWGGRPPPWDRGGWWWGMRDLPPPNPKREPWVVKVYFNGKWVEWSRHPRKGDATGELQHQKGMGCPFRFEVRHEP